MQKYTEDLINNAYMRCITNTSRTNAELYNPELYAMCKRCEEWCGEEHDWEECRNKPCFQFWLAYEALEFLATWQ